MNSKSTFTNRRDEAKSAARFAGVIQRNSADKPTMITVPGHNGKQYDVIVKRLEGGLLVCECRLYTGKNGYAPCPGSNFVCYHALGSVIAVAQDSGYSLVLCHSEKDAKRLINRYGGAVLKVVNKVGSDEVFAVAYKPTPDVLPKNA